MTIQQNNMVLASTPDPLYDTNSFPSLDLQFATTKTLNDEVSGQNLVTFTRASTGTYVDSSGVIQTAAIDAPRFDHDSVTGASLGLLVEESRTNLLQYSNTLDGGLWTNTFGSPVAVATNSGIAPDGTFSASKLIEGNTTGIQRWLFNSYFSPATGWTGTFFAKAAERDNISLQLGFGGGSIQARFNLSTQTATYTGNSNYATQTTQKITALPNGWYKCELTTTGNIGGNSVAYSLYITDSSGNTSYTGDGVSGIYVWGAQLEQASFPTSYIPTSGSAVTRAADVAEITGTNFSSWYNQSEGTVFADAICNNLGGGGSISFVGFLYASSNQYIDVLRYQPTARAVVTDTGLQSILNTAIYSGSSHKSAHAFKSNDFALSVDGEPVLTDTLGSLPSVSALKLGNDYTNGRSINGHISRLTYYPYRLPDAKLQTITS